MAWLLRRSTESSSPLYAIEPSEYISDRDLKWCNDVDRKYRFSMRSVVPMYLVIVSNFFNVQRTGIRACSNSTSMPLIRTIPSQIWVVCPTRAPDPSTFLLVVLIRQSFLSRCLHLLSMHDMVPLFRTRLICSPVQLWSHCRPCGRILSCVLRQPLLWRFVEIPPVCDGLQGNVTRGIRARLIPPSVQAWQL